ncbi:DNA-binding helix-turn-helix protein [Proteus penneri ATCC 35198]|nr:DNA-binding helix-turn-helix protein [Proteus penneri ATCC 35198]
MLVYFEDPSQKLDIRIIEYYWWLIGRMRSLMSKIYPISQIIGHKIRKQRQQLRLSAKVVAERVGISQQQFSRYENGLCKIDVDMLFHIAQELKVTPAFFLPPNEEQVSAVALTQSKQFWSAQSQI